MTEKDLKIQDLKKENRKLREENQQLREKLPRWIPVEEKLPECETENGDVIPVWVTYLSYVDKKTPLTGALAIYDHECDCWRWYDDELNIREMERCQVEIIAWMPTLTEPYNPEKNESAWKESMMNTFLGGSRMRQSMCWSIWRRSME